MYLANINFSTLPKLAKVIFGLEGSRNGEVTLLQGAICTVEFNLGLSQGDGNGEVFLLVR